MKQLDEAIDKRSVLKRVKHCPQCGEELDEGWQELVGIYILGKTMLCHNCMREWKVECDTDGGTLRITRTNWYGNRNLYKDNMDLCTACKDAVEVTNDPTVKRMLTKAIAKAEGKLK